MSNRRLPILVLLGWFALPAAARSPIDLPQIVGSWEWTRAENNCTEVYTFEADGRAHVTSGAEVSENLYLVLDRSTNGRRYRVDIATVSENAKKDCADVAADDTGTSHSIWIEFSPTGDRMLMCASEDGFDCFGPLRKKRGI